LLPVIMWANKAFDVALLRVDGAGVASREIECRDPKVGGFVSRTVCVEPRIGNTSCVADLHLQAVPGSEAGVALAIAKLTPVD
jgi:anaerobic selenocysteine-containing dehydrogenase